MSSSDPPGVRSNGHPQPFDPAQVKLYVARIRRLVIALGADATGDEYRRVLEQVIDETFEGETFEGADTQQAFHDRLAYLIYAAALFGLGTLTLLTELTNTPRERAQQLLDQALATWLEQTAG